MMAWADVEAAFSGILERRWYTNHGPLAQALEHKAAAAFAVRHAIAVTNPAIGLIMLAEALHLSGEVILPALAPGRCAQSLSWAGLRPVFCDVDPGTLGITAEQAACCIGPDTSAILGIAGADEEGLARLAAAHGLAFFQDGRGHHPAPALLLLPCHGDDAGAACITTQDDTLAARVRNIRSSYGAGSAAPVARTANGRLSEAQAAMALLGLKQAPGQACPVGTYRAGLPGRHVVRLGGRAALLTSSTGERSRACAALVSAGFPSDPFVLDPRASGCPVSVEGVSRAVLLPQVLEQTAAVCAVLRGVC